MKKIYLMAAMFAATTISGQNADFESIILANESYWNGSDYSGTTNGVGLFDTTITDGFHEFSNQYDTTWGASWGFWSGWAFSNQTADTTSGLPGQYSSYAGGAYNGSNYAIGQDGSEINLAGAAGTWLRITNANYAAHSMLNGDGFAKQFGSPNDANGTSDGTNGEDWFLMTIVGYDLSDSIVDSIQFYLADYRFSDTTQDYIIKNWKYIDLTSLGSLERIKFKLSSSDVGQFGMNTPAFFAIDDLLQAPIGIEENKLTSHFYPNPTSGIINIQTNAKNSTIEIFDITGKQISSKNYTSEMFQLNISSFSAGTYYAVLSSETSRKTTKLIKL